MSPAGVRNRLDVRIGRKSYRGGLGRRAARAGRACADPRGRRGRGAGRAVRLRQDHPAADRRRARARLRRDREPAGAMARSGWCFRNRACCLGAPSSRTCGWQRRKPPMPRSMRCLHAGAHRPSRPLSGRAVTRARAAGRARARIRGRAGSAAARRAVRVARRNAGGAPARRTGGAGAQPSGDDAARNA